MANPQPSPAPAPAPSSEPTKDFTPARSPLEQLRDMTRVPVAGGVLEPARVGRAPGIRFTKKFSKGGKIDGCAQRGKTKCKVV